MTFKTLILFIHIFHQGRSLVANKNESSEQDLLNEILADYNPLAPPFGKNNSFLPLQVTFDLKILCLELTEDGFLRGTFQYSMKWKDRRLAWSIEKYNVYDIRLPHSKIWVPDIVIGYSDSEEKFDPRQKARILQDGTIYSIQKVLIKLRCSDVDFSNPWGHHKCAFNYLSWTYDGNSIDLKIEHEDDDSSLNLIYDYCQLEILSAKAKGIRRFYSCCPEPYLNIEYELIVKRKWMLGSRVKFYENKSSYFGYLKRSLWSYIS